MMIHMHYVGKRLGTQSNGALATKSSPEATLVILLCSTETQTYTFRFSPDHKLTTKQVKTPISSFFLSYCL